MPSNSTLRSAPPLQLLFEWSQARAAHYRAGEYSLAEATKPLVHYAVNEPGLARYSRHLLQKIIALPFQGPTRGGRA
jgi:hypothetical protein